MGQNLQRLRKEAGLSQSALAKAAGVPIGSLRNWEQGRRKLFFDAAVRIAEVLGVNLNDLRPPPAGGAKPQKRKRR